MNAPRTINEYLDQLRAALRGADPALVQDALYDAEEHLRAELAEQPSRGEADMLAHVVGSYGAPDEVAELYRDQEIRIQRALRPPSPPKRRSLAGRFFGVAADPRTYGALFYMVLALATGIFYFTWAVTGVSLSAGLSILIVGLPFIVLFFGSVRVLSLVEGRIVEAMLGARMPRRPPYPTRDLTLMKRIGSMFTDARTWTTLLYMLLMLPLGIVYFTIAVTLVSVSVAFIGAPVAWMVNGGDLSRLFVDHRVIVHWGFGEHVPGWGEVIGLCVLGVLLLFATLHLARGLGRMHGQVARHLLVRG
ncbi:sensor domain-containing protein [Frateuria soli]|uniref:sensor domain-containing protein n=1 Tax=Frateuria soli TaxID=1542730 RepID=UPI001E31B62B|nr:sensor domain-containing protein [Frateuria soli]UGB39203.1 sensor domain-containing protein [Frateuria soli]